MRLTLRTLLAYLDDVLDPVDKEELAHKIESSEFAEDLVHRTRDTVRRLRLSAPQVIGTGMGLDPNTVAEYLDNVMPPEHVGDFERICLESDVHLAEATACHHVLTMVLGEPADVDPLARQRMYTIAAETTDGKQLRIEPAHAIPSAVAAATVASVPAQPVATPLATAQRPHAVEIPDYLRAGSWWRSSSAVIGLAIVVLIGTAIVFATGLRGWLGQKPAPEPLIAQNSAPALETGAANAVPGAETPTTDSAIESAATPPAATAPPLGAPPQPTTPSLPPLAAPAAQANSTEPDRYATPSNAAATPPQPPAASDVSMPLPPPSAGPATPNVIAPSSTATPPAAATSSSPGPFPTTPSPQLPIPPAPSDSVANTLPTIPEASATAVPPAASLAAATPAAPHPVPLTPAGDDSAATAIPPKATAPAAPPNSGTYMGGKTVLLRYDDKSGAWFRVEPRAAIVPGERVLSLPEFRPKITLVCGLQLDLSGGTQIVMGGGSDAASEPPTAGITPSIELVYGRIVLINPTNVEISLHLKLGSQNGVAKLAHNATLAVEVERKHVPGQDPRQTPAPVETRLFAPDGSVVWHDAAGDKSIDKASRWTLTEAGASEVANDPAPPEWIDHEPIVQLSEQRFGAPVIESTLVSNVPAETQLLELFQGSSRKEVKSLVARSSIHVGLFQPFIDALRDSEQKANWKMHIETLRSAMALNSASAERVWKALVDQRGKPAAADLYEMLCGYNDDQIGRTPEQIKTGSIAKLINWLEDDSLDYRVLAVQDLWEITGKRLMPDPAASLAERTRNVRRWRSRLEAGELKPPSPPKAD
jgi:hypothetical protein